MSNIIPFEPYRARVLSRRAGAATSDHPTLQALRRRLGPLSSIEEGHLQALRDLFAEDEYYDHKVADDIERLLSNPRNDALLLKAFLRGLIDGPYPSGQ